MLYVPNSVTCNKNNQRKYGNDDRKIIKVGKTRNQVAKKKVKIAVYTEVDALK